MRASVYAPVFVASFFVAVLASSSLALAFPIFSANATLPVGSAIYNKGANISFDITWTDTVGGTNLGNVTFRIGQPDGAFKNYTFTTTPAINNGTATRFFINFTQDMFGAVGTYNFTWIARNGTGTQNTTGAVNYDINRTTQSVTILLNGSSANREYEKGSGVNITITTNSTDSSAVANMRIFTNFTGSNATIANTSGVSTNFASYNETDTTSLSLSNYTVSANITQTANYSLVTNDTVFIILRDTTPPSISGLTISPTIAAGGSTITISTSSISDLDGSTNTIKVTKPGGTSTTVSYTSPHSYSDTNILAGDYNVEVRATDPSGNSGVATGSFEIRISGGVSGGGGGGAGGGDATKEIRIINIGPDKMFTVTMNKQVDHGVVDITIEVNNPANNVQISVQKLAGLPASVTHEVSGTVYRYIDISKSGVADTNVKSGKISFQVEKSWLSENNIELGSVALNRFAGGVWQELVTRLVSSDDTTYIFEADTLGFSTFAITGEQAAAPAEEVPSEEAAPITSTETQPTEVTPTFAEPTFVGYDRNTLAAIGIAVIVLIGLAVFFMKKKKKRHKEGPF